MLPFKVETVLVNLPTQVYRRGNNNQNKKWSDNSEVVWWFDVSDYSFEKTLWGVFMRLCDLKYQTTRQSEFSRSLSNYVINEQLPKDP